MSVFSSENEVDGTPVTETIASSVRNYRAEKVSPSLSTSEYVNVPVGLGLFHLHLARADGTGRRAGAIDRKHICN